MSVEDKRMEDRLRKMLGRQGFRLCKSRKTVAYMIINAFTNIVEAGEIKTSWEMNLDDVERFALDA